MSSSEIEGLNLCGVTAYVCGWCELDRNSEWLTLIPHPLPPASSRRWKYRTEIESLGRVVAVAVQLTE
jgi:hypothetical protein